MKKNVLDTTAKKPMQAVGFILTLVMLFTGLWLVSPFFAPSSSVAARISGDEQTLPFIFGIWQLLIATFWLSAFFHKNYKIQYETRRVCTMAMFVTFAFYGVAGIILHGLTDIRWFSTLALAFTAAIKYLWLGANEDGD